eukprot:535028_1
MSVLRLLDSVLNTLEKQDDEKANSSYIPQTNDVLEINHSMKNKWGQPKPLCSLEIHQNYYIPLLKDHLPLMMKNDIYISCILEFVCGDLDELDGDRDDNTQSSRRIKECFSEFHAKRDTIEIMDDDITENDAIDSIENFKEKDSKTTIYSVWRSNYRIDPLSTVWVGWNEHTSDKRKISITLSSSLDIFLNHINR